MAFFYKDAVHQTQVLTSLSYHIETVLSMLKYSTANSPNSPQYSLGAHKINVVKKIAELFIDNWPINCF